MSWKALYRTYRPTTFEEVAGQEHIVRTLKNALTTGKIAHAYLFAGPRGTGKTTMAKLFAKALNCEEGIGHQCNNCKNCLAISDGSHPDVTELDAASNNGVNQIRDLIDRVKYGTILGKYKVYIIDEVHMLSDAAFNALLKTLEEPPEHVVFILATTEPQAILPTILSRCQRYDFTKLSEQDIANRLKIVLDSEKVPYSDEAIRLLSVLADGGMRDALSMLEQVLAYSTTNELKLEDVLKIFSLESLEEKVNLISLIANGNTKDVLDKVNAYFLKGSDIKRLTDDMLMILKDVLIYDVSFRTDYLQLLNENQVIQLSKVISEKKVLAMIEALMDTLKNYKTVSSINPLFEVTVLKLCSIAQEGKTVSSNNDKNEEIVQKPAQNTIKIEPKEDTLIKVQPKTDEIIIPQEDIKIEGVKNLVILKDTVLEDSYYINPQLMLQVMIKSNKAYKKEILDKWSELRRLAAHPTLGPVASYLSDSHPLVASQKVLVVECQFQKTADILNKIDKQQELQDVVFNVFGKNMFVFVISRNRSIEEQRNYANLLQIGKLPKADTIQLKFEGE